MNLSNLYILEIRIIKILAMILFSINISIATVIFQIITNNLIITPSILGMNSIYLTTHTAIVFLFGIFNELNTNNILSFLIDVSLMSIFSVFIYKKVFKITKYNILYILLIGIIISSLFSSIQETLIRLIDPNDYQSLLATLTPGISNINKFVLALSYILSIIVIILLRKDMNKLDILQLSKNISINLGLNYNKLINRLLFYVSILVAISTATFGNLIFIGLITTNLSRYLLGYKAHKIMISSIFITFILIVFSDIFAVKIFKNNVPINVFLDFLGGLYFAYLFLKGNYLRKGVL